MLTKFITFLCTAIATFLLGFTLQPENLAFKATMAPVVIFEEAIPSPTKAVSLNLSFEIHPRAIDLLETVSSVSSECQQLYEVYEPVAIDVFNTASDELARTYETYQPLACELFGNTIRPVALDLLDIVSTGFQQQVYEMCGFFAKDQSVPYSLFDYGRIEVMAVSYDATRSS